jgi:hypothetical protein
MQLSLDYHVFEDRDQFDNMHPSAVLAHFKQWAVTAPQQEQGEGAYLRAHNDTTIVFMSTKKRYSLLLEGRLLLRTTLDPGPSIWSAR